MDAVAAWFRWLDRAHGINLTIFYDSYDRTRFLAGIATTVELSLVCIAASLVIGVVGAGMLGSQLRPLRLGVQGYVQGFRNTPPLVQLYFFYFAIGNVLPRLGSAGGRPAPLLGNFSWAAISLSLFAGAFNVEIFRAGIEAVPRPMAEAAQALGLTRLAVYRHVVLPLALRISLPALGNNLVNLVKTTTLAYAIGVPELLYASAQIWSEELNVREMMNVMLVVYIGLVAVLAYAMRRWERALHMPGYNL